MVVPEMDGAGRVFGPGHVPAAARGDVTRQAQVGEFMAMTGLGAAGTTR
jgi:hypothetical protein